MDKLDQKYNFPRVKKLAVLFDPNEDRISLLVLLGERVYQEIIVTRRIYMILIEHYSDLFKKSHSLSKVPSDLRNEVLKIEHMQAKKTDLGSPLSDQWLSNLGRDDFTPKFLVTEIKYQTSEDEIKIGLLGVNQENQRQTNLKVEPICAFVMNNLEAHKLLAALVDEGRGADWHKIIPHSIFLENAEQVPLETLVN